MALTTITQKVLGSDTYAEKKLLATDINQIREAIQTGALDIKPNNISMEGNEITADAGQNWIRRSSNKFQFYDAGTWKEPVTLETTTFTAGESISIRDVVYVNTSDGKIYKASSSNSDWIGVAREAISIGSSGQVYLNGSLVGGFSGLTIGSWYGLNATAGTITANENYVVGKAISATQIILLKPKGDISTRDNALYKLQGEKAINDVSATNSGVLAGSSQVLIDKFLEVNGQNNTVDTGNTTANYNTTNKYYDGLGLSTIVLDPSFETVANWTYSETDSVFSGAQSTSHVTNGTYSYLITNTSGGTRNGSFRYGEILQSVDFTNINTLKVDVYLTASSSSSYTMFKILIDATELVSVQPLMGVGAVTYTFDVSAYTGTNNLIFRCGHNTPGGLNAPEAMAWIDNIRTEPFQDKITQSVATTIPSGKKKVFVTPLMYEALDTGDSVTADVSIDGGSTYTENIPVNTWTTITSTSGTSLIVKANLNTNDGTTTPKILGWRCLLE